MNVTAQTKRINNHLQLHKFGGSSLADVECYLRVAHIITKYSKPNDIIVVSAAGNTTDQLIRWLKSSQINWLSAHQVRQSIFYYQSNLIANLASIKAASDLTRILIHDLERLEELLNHHITEAVYAEVVGYGEIWSARLMEAVLKKQGIKTVWIDARDFLRAERTAQPQINVSLSYPLIQKFLIQHYGKRIVVTGFISRNKNGETILLGRNGSDYSATQIGALAGASKVTIWSDVAGIYSADPKRVKDARLLPYLRLDEASELARLASPILHARTLQPVFESDIDLQLRCSYSPNQGSTYIGNILTSSKRSRILTSHTDICMIEFKNDVNQNFKLVQENFNVLFEREQIHPLVIGIHNDHQLLQFCYTTEMVSDALKIFSESGFAGRINLNQGLSLIAVVGYGVTCNPLQVYLFWRKLKSYPVEFIWKSQEGLSLVAVLRMNQIENLEQELHTALFREEKNIGLILFGKWRIDFYWKSLFIRENSVLLFLNRFKLILIIKIKNRFFMINCDRDNSCNALKFFRKSGKRK